MAKKTNPFHFKQFTIIQEKTAMKVGTDGVILGAWIELTDEKRILDIGAGTGLITLMLAQKLPHARYDAIEIDKASCEEARLNISNSPWSDNISLHNTDITNYRSSYKYDLIVSNPPFFIGTKSPNEGRHTARNIESLTHQTLLTTCTVYLINSGRLCFIMPVSEAELFIESAKHFDFNLSRLTHFIPKPNKPVERFLMEFRKGATDCKPSQIVQYNDDGSWSEQYKELTRSYYLKL